MNALLTHPFQHTIFVWVYWTLWTILAAICLPFKIAAFLLNRVKPDLREQVERSLKDLVISREDIKAYLVEKLGIKVLHAVYCFINGVAKTR